MSNLRTQILRRIGVLEKRVEQLESENQSAKRFLEFEKLPATATVGKDYVAYRFHCSEQAVMRGRAGTHRLTPLRLTKKPLKWRKRDVDAAWHDHTQPKEEKAADAIANAPSVSRRRSIITKREVAK